jgi:hypothetical protein
MLTNPDAIVTKNFKAKYFPNGDLLGGSLGHNPSYEWRNICLSRVLLKEGYRWRIGNSESIPIWNNLWLRNEVNPLIITPNQNLSGCLKVSDLVDEETNSC